MKIARWLGTWLVAFCGFALAARAAEPWVDGRLSRTNGLLLWIDVSRQNAARGNLQLAPLRSWSDGADYIFDGSGAGRHLAQPVAAARPRFRQEFSGAMLSFDGTDDFLSGPGWGSPGSFTVFVVAAPRTNGGFRALLSGNATGRNDYTSGFNLDLGARATESLSWVNAEGAGFAGEANLLADTGLGRTAGWGRWHVFALECAPGAGGVRLRVDGSERGRRDRTPGAAARVDEFTLGGRHYSNDSDRPSTRDLLAGDVAEVLVYGTVLDEAARGLVEDYLTRKYTALLSGAGSASGATAWAPMTNPPPVQVFVPGFEARALPVALNNVNNVKYRPDGALVANGYDGRLWLLRDMDGDGAEDRADLYWDSKGSIRSPIGMALTPPGYSHGDGVFLAAKDKLVLVVDTNRDDHADREIVVATWTERSEQQGVDALGVAVGPDGSVYFSLGAASFTDGYVVDRATGRSRYRDLKERGTIQRVLPDFSRRETVCTGIRFAVAMAFDRAGELFCTDQEGATWLPNGNPLDELLHIQTGRHYGFPPRHPRHLPDAIDEPSVFDYAPQHQSTCGLNFNEGVAGGPVFGFPGWAGDAIVSGYSRGKLWRTQLARTPAGYVARSQLLATLQELTVDACVSPRGDLVVATHTGKPDWGSGPGGPGHLWRIRRTNTTDAVPLMAWPAGPGEVSVAFDRALDPDDWKGAGARVSFEEGTYVFPGDRFENLWPGYQVVHDQHAAPRYPVAVSSLRLSADRRTLSLATGARRWARRGALSLPTRAGTADLAVDPNGVQATWTGADGKEAWSGWLPHPEPSVARAMTAGSAEHARLFALAGGRGVLRVRGQLDLAGMLQPAVQPGATLDHVRPREVVTVEVTGARAAKSRSGAAWTASADGARWMLVATNGPGTGWVSFDVEFETGAGDGPSWSWHTGDDARPRAFPLRRFLMPWMEEERADGPAPARGVPEEIAGANWLHGRRVFFGGKAACARCHAIRGEGGHVGPDLSNLIYRDVASVRKDIEFPNAALNPDHVASELTMSDGETTTALVLREEGGELVLGDATGTVRKVRRSDVRTIRPAALSLMPEGLWDLLDAGERRDLLAFLLMEPIAAYPVPEDIQGHAAPPARGRAEWLATIPYTAGAGTTVRPRKIVLCASPKDAGHGAPGFHDYPLWRERWAKLMALGDGVSVETAERWPTDAQWASADLVVFYHDNPAWEASRAADMDRFLARGGGLVFLHWSMNAYRDVGPLAGRMGWAWGPGARFRHGAEELKFLPDALTAGLGTLGLVDETYWQLTGGGEGTRVLATCVEEGETRPQAWVRDVGPGKVFVCIPGHFTWTFDDPAYRLFVLRGMAWAAGEPMERWMELVPVGARWGP